MTADIKDEFFHVPVAREHRDYLGFSYKRLLYRWKVLPFGLCCSPYCFSKVVRPVITYLRSIGLQVTVYVDDFLLAAEESCSADHIDQLIHTLTELGFIINFEKSQLVASNKISYIGYSLSSDQGQVRIKAQTAHISKLKPAYAKPYNKKV